MPFRVRHLLHVFKVAAGKRLGCSCEWQTGVLVTAQCMLQCKLQGSRSCHANRKIDDFNILHMPHSKEMAMPPPSIVTQSLEGWASDPCHGGVEKDASG